VQVRVQPRAALRTAEAQPRPFTVTARPAEAPGWTCTVQGAWVQLPSPRPAIRTWGPLVLSWLGWVAAWVAGMHLAVFLLGRYGTPLRDFLAQYDPYGWGIFLSRHLLPDAAIGLLVGLFGGLITALFVWWAEPTLRVSHVLYVFLGWFVVLLLEGVTSAGFFFLRGAVPANGWISILSAVLHRVIFGLVGGAITGVVLRRALPRARPLPVALGWAFAWGLGEGLLILSTIRLDDLLQTVFAGLLDPDYAVSLAGLVILATVIGLGGGVTTLWEIARARRRVEF